MKKARNPEKNLPSFLIAEFFEYSFAEFNTKSFNSFFGKIPVGAAAENFNIGHSISEYALNNKIGLFRLCMILRQ